MSGLVSWCEFSSVWFDVALLCSVCSVYGGRFVRLLFGDVCAVVPHPCARMFLLVACRMCVLIVPRLYWWFYC